MNLKTAEKLALDKLTKNFDGLSFSSRIINNDSLLEISINNIRITGHEDDIEISMSVTTGEIAYLCMAFDYLDKTPEAYDALNNFNATNAMFKAYIHDNGYLVLESNMPIYSEEEFADQATQFMLRGNHFKDNESLKRLTSLTYKTKSN